VNGQRTRHALAWGVHTYTILGGVLGMLALVALVDGNTPVALLLLAVAIVIDMTDGMLARKCKVWEVLPDFDGAKVDDLVDFLTYVWAPVLILHVEGLVTNPLWLLLPVVGSLYAYGRPGMKEIEGEAFFVGFPSYWNIFVLYVYWLQPAESVTVALLLIFFVLSFLPTRYLYPSKNPKFPLATLGLGAIWLVLIGSLLAQPTPDTTLVMISLFYPVYYLVASFYVEIDHRVSQLTDRMDADRLDAT
jgi:phosphatidylcholine synthase